MFCFLPFYSDVALFCSLAMLFSVLLRSALKLLCSAPLSSDIALLRVARLCSVFLCSAPLYSDIAPFCSALLRVALFWQCCSLSCHSTLTLLCSAPLCSDTALLRLLWQCFSLFCSVPILPVGVLFHVQGRPIFPINFPPLYSRRINFQQVTFGSSESYFSQLPNIEN